MRLTTRAVIAPGYCGRARQDMSGVLAPLARMGAPTLARTPGGRHDGPMASSSPGGCWSRRDLRRRWGSLLLLGLVAGIAAGVTVATLDGARRTSSALARLNERTKASDAVIFASQTSFDIPDWSKLRTRPEVETLATWGLVFGEADGEDTVFFTATDDIFLEQVNVPIVTAGRMFDPTSPNEAILAVSTSIDDPDIPRVGDSVAFATYGPDAFTGGPFTSQSAGRDHHRRRGASRTQPHLHRRDLSVPGVRGHLRPADVDRREHDGHRSVARPAWPPCAAMRARTCFPASPCSTCTSPVAG